MEIVFHDTFLLKKFAKSWEENTYLKKKLPSKLVILNTLQQQKRENCFGLLLVG